MTKTDVEISPSAGSVRERVRELAAQRPGLGERLMRLQEFSRGVRTAEVFVTDACDLRCDGCWFFAGGLDKQGTEVRDLDAIRNFAEVKRAEGVTHVLLLGGEPSLFPRRLRVWAEVMPYVTVVTNGQRPVPREGLENITVAVSLWGGGRIDDELRGHRPNGDPIHGLMDMALRTYRNDPRVVWIYTISSAGFPYIEETVQKIAENGNRLNFGIYNANGTSDDAVRQRGEDALVAKMMDMRAAYPETVIGDASGYYYRTLATGRTHWGAKWGYDVCPSVSVDDPANADRLTNGNPVLPGFNTYRSDHELQGCCTSGACATCTDSQAMWSWLLVSQKHFLESAEQLELWVELVENFYRQFHWAPYSTAG